MPGRDGGGRDLSIGTPVTFVDHVRSDGVIVRWESRRHRKHLKEPAGSTWWAPRARGWWIAVLFAIGSLLFALGAIPGYASAVGAEWDNVTFFIGSLFFTSAAFLTYREAVDAAPPAFNPAHRRFFVYQPSRPGSVYPGSSGLFTHVRVSLRSIPLHKPSSGEYPGTYCAICALPKAAVITPRVCSRSSSKMCE